MIDASVLRLGEEVRVKTYRGKRKDFEGKIVALRDTHSKSVSKKARKEHRVTRSQYLLTLQNKDGNCKSFYHAFVETE